LKGLLFFRKGRWFQLSKASGMFNYPSAVNGLVYIGILTKLRLHISRCYLAGWLFHLVWQRIWLYIATISLSVFTLYVAGYI